MKSRKLFICTMIMVMFLLCLSACSNNENANTSSDTNTSSSEENVKGSRKNPYTFADVITISSYAWEGNRYDNPKILGANTFELSNFRIETQSLAAEFAGKTKQDYVDVKMIAFDQKCIETCFDDGVQESSNGNLWGRDFYDSNMQTLEYVKYTKKYNNMEETSPITYFEGTKYTQCFAFFKKEDNLVVATNSDCSLMRIGYYDNELKDKYIYIKVD